MTAAPPPAVLPRVPVTDPPVSLPPGLKLTPLYARQARGGALWFREVRIPLWCAEEFRRVWKQHKLGFLTRGYSLRQHEGAWILQQWLAGASGSHTLTEIGAEMVQRAMNPQPALIEEAPPPALLDLPPLPHGLEEKLFPYQRQPARQLYRAVLNGKAEWDYPGAWDCSELGTGKTYQALAAALATGLEVGVICPKSVIGTYPKYGGRGSGWLGAFAHFGQLPRFVLNYEGLRTGNRDVVKRTNNLGRPFEWTIDPQDVILIWDEAHNCFPGDTMIATENGGASIAYIVENKLPCRVISFDFEVGVTTIQKVTGWFKNPPSPKVRITHENGEFTCTGNHRVWTVRGWKEARSLDAGDLLRALLYPVRADIKESDAAILREEVLEDAYHELGRSREARGMAIQGSFGPGDSADNRDVPVPSVRGEISGSQPEAVPLQQPVCGALSDAVSRGAVAACPVDAGSPEGNVTGGKGVPLGTDEKEQSHEAESGAGEDAEVASGAYVCRTGREWQDDQATGGGITGDGFAYGVPCGDSRGGPQSIQESADEVHGGLGVPGSEARSGDRRRHSQAEEMAVPGQEKDGYTFFTRVVRVEVLESGSGLGPSGGDSEDFLYDLEVEGTHCYFADGILVHNCKNKSLNRSMAFSALRQGFPCIFVSGTMAASPVNLGATGVAVGLHGGDKASYERFLVQHGCRNMAGSWEFPRGKAGAVHLAKIHRTVFPKRGARVKISDLGDMFPESQIICEAVETDGTAAIAEAWRAARDTIAKLEEMGGNVEVARATAYMEAWHQSERIKVPTIVDIVRREIEGGRSVAIFVNFTDVRESLMRELKTTCAIFGGQSQPARDACIADFQAGRSRVIVANTKAGGVGVSLHDIDGEYPRTAIILPTNNAVEMGQALGRVHRAGGKSKSRQIVVFSMGTVEEEICESTRRKLSSIATLNDGDLSPPSKF